jgi:hypothetical protein
LCVLDHKVFTKSTQIEFYLEHGMIGKMKSKEQKEQNPPILSLNEYRSFLTILFKTWNDWKLESKERNLPVLSLNEYRSCLKVV